MDESRGKQPSKLPYMCLFYTISTLSMNGLFFGTIDVHIDGNNWVGEIPQGTESIFCSFRASLDFY